MILEIINRNSKSKADVMMVAMGTSLHFLVDSLCACCLFLLADGEGMPQLLGVFMVYNVLAFLTQPLTGMLADRIGQPQMLMVLSVALLSLGVAVASLGFLLFTSILLGLGNSLFHVWGGRQVAVQTANDIRALGVFVSTGAFGLAVGMAFHSWVLLYAFLFAIVGMTIYTLRKISSIDSVCEVSFVPNQLKPWMIWCSALVLMAVVMLRSQTSECFSAEMEKGRTVMLIIGAVAMLGKATGGFLAKGVGIVWTIALVLTGVVLASLFSKWVLGLLCVNLSMSVTLYLINLAMPGREGLAFGLLASALVPGYMVAQFSEGGFSVIPSLMATLLLTIIIELLVLRSLRERRADVLWSSVVVNILTNVTLNLFVTYVSNSVVVIIMSEVFVVLIEALWYWYFVKQWHQAIVYSFLCNGISFLLGLLAQFMILFLTL